MNARGVLYYNIGDRYAVPLAVSLMTLRDWYAGPVAIVTDMAGIPWIRKMLKIPGLLPLDIIPMLPESSSEQWRYLAKLELPELSPFASTVMLDADTLVVGSIEELWPDMKSGEVVLTNRSNGATAHVKMRLRCQQWIDIAPLRARRVRSQRFKVAAINTGIMAWSRNSSPFVREWYRLARLRPIHSCDEMAAQLTYPDFPHRILDSRYNANVTYDREDVRIWHGPRSQFWKAGGRGRALWTPYFRRELPLLRELLPTAAWLGGWLERETGKA